MGERLSIERIAQHRTIVLEGCDGAGKSTLTELLATGYGFASVHSPRTPDNQDLPRRYRELLDRPGCLVMDRCFLSELVYGPLYRGHSRLTWRQALDLARLVTERQGVFLHLTAPAEVLHDRLKARDGHAPPLAEITALAYAYQQAFDILSAHAPVLTYDTAPNTSPTDG